MFGEEGGRNRQIEQNYPGNWDGRVETALHWESKDLGFICFLVGEIHHPYEGLCGWTLQLHPFQLLCFLVHDAVDRDLSAKNTLVALCFYHTQRHHTKREWEGWAFVVHSQGQSLYFFPISFSSSFWQQNNDFERKPRGEKEKRPLLKKKLHIYTHIKPIHHADTCTPDWFTIQARE